MASPASWLYERRRSGTSLAAGVVLGGLVILALGIARSVEIPDAVVVVLFFYLVAYLVITAVAFTRADPDDVRRWADLEERGNFLERYVLGTAPGPGVSVFVASAAMGVTVFWLPGLVPSGLPDDARIGVSFLLVAVAWGCVLMSFLVTFLADNLLEDEKALEFPGRRDDTPKGRRSDYFYFAVSVMTTFGTTDVNVTSSALRRTVAVNAVIAFVFNTVIVATVVSALAA